MKKKIIIVAILLSIIIIPIYIAINEVNRNKNEALELFNKYASFYIYLEKDIDDVDLIKQRIMEIKYVKSVEVQSKEDKLNDFNDIRNKYNLEPLYNSTGFNNSFYVRFEFEKENLNNIKEIKNNLANEIYSIKGVEKIDSSFFCHLINTYNAKGTNGLKQVCNFYEGMRNMNSEGIVKYYEDNQELVDEYSQYQDIYE